MALGKNMKVEKLIPLKPKKGTTGKTVKKEEKVEKNVNVDLDTFFNDIENESKAEKTGVHIDSLGEVGGESLELENLTEKKIEEVVLKESEPELAEGKKSKGFSQEDIENDSIKITFKPSRRKTQKRIFIDIEGDVTIKNAELLYSNVNAVFEYFDHVEINMVNIKKVDLSVIQLFHVIRVNYFPQNKFIYLNADFEREDRKLLNVCGFTEFQTQKVAQN